ncbi:hypothetical protein CWRG_00815 [Chthonomonas calidirosea]|uniref:HEAT repeat domain-containing protein n=1 Tax=Chthonomonas calidirosea (strain DSM 23976 / ICMP 18418 / T49) TaxID=1303518 RepID=S0ESE4_CHTCT|nr:hypothetical protein CCALI_00334 [Chthonomonas calidirosea T49]CEK14392.1 hypothetical protein CP488_00823 [Chthonomonas calidirosea]CEK14393.1 hypothetical protein CWRG_00815 [Chthonomonas calidirosea]CEK15556.1 hypothetical protein CTKA_00823 [Chthonomonas calidirosea]
MLRLEEFLLQFACGVFLSFSVLTLGFLGIDFVGRDLFAWLQRRRCWRQPCSALVHELAPLLLSEDSRVAIDAAMRLADAGDCSAVPHLVHALRVTVEMQHPGWRERGEVFTEALAKLGDGRALPLLRELEDVRGIGFIPSIRRAILYLEPRSLLLRAGTLPSDPPALLLQPVGRHVEELKTLLHILPKDRGVPYERFSMHFGEEENVSLLSNERAEPPQGD